VNHEAQRTVAVRCADRPMSVRNLNGRRVHHQQRTNDPEE